jgi:hypothetical protein
MLRHGEVEGRFPAQLLHPTESGQHRSLILLDGEKAGENASHQKPRQGTDYYSNNPGHRALC